MLALLASGALATLVLEQPTGLFNCPTGSNPCNYCKKRNGPLEGTVIYMVGWTGFEPATP